MFDRFSLLASFDREYRRAYDMLTPEERFFLVPADRPPVFGAIFCRRFFKELELKSVSLRQRAVQAL